MAGETKGEPGKAVSKSRYRVTNWAEYDRALVRRGDLTLWFDAETLLNSWTAPPTEKRGRPRR